MSAAPARPADVAAALEGSGCCLVDVRTPVEFGSVHVEGATNVPLDQLESRLHEVAGHAGDRRLVLVCRSGQRAQKALEILERRTDLRPEVLEGGVEAWERAGLPVVRGAEVMSLERQVRIAAGCPSEPSFTTWTVCALTTVSTSSVGEISMKLSSPGRPTSSRSMMLPPY